MKALLFTLALLFLPLPLYAQASQQDPAAFLREQMSTIRDSGAQLQVRIQTAKEKLDEVARIATEDEKEAKIDDLFITLRSEIFATLSQLDSSSAFADALNRAREGAIVLKNWYERQPADYPNRDTNIQRLSQAVEKYNALENELEESRNLVHQKLVAVVRQHRIIVQQMKIDKVLEALDSARAVVEGLNDITQAIAVVEERTNETLNTASPISN